jgi:ribosome-binding protein aMBF1 (putative translation factor)
MKTQKTKNATKLLDTLIGDDQELRDMVAEEHLSVRVARMIYDARAEAGLSQKQLASLIGTIQSVKARLEDADYEGHSLSMLQWIAEALGKRVEISFAKRPRRRRGRTPAPLGGRIVAGRSRPAGGNPP